MTGVPWIPVVFVALMTAATIFLGVLIYPITVVLSFYFVAASNRIEADCADWRKALAEEEGR